MVTWQLILIWSGVLVGFGTWTLATLLIGLLLGHRIVRGKEPKLGLPDFRAFNSSPKEIDPDELLGEPKDEANRWSA